jgi:hypothetical protein
MNRKDINHRSPGFYDPEHRNLKARAIASVTYGLSASIFFVLICGAFWHALTETLDSQQRHHCEQGWQPACEKLK